ncbi:hypothetical protein GALMADRAFT_143253 [Galerina marginata CBS 339.88]|uniref:F-box domain-containing protein n=1 Tax=Galerina marginata (strain CBS 339.88) TaxID=685588 RepID=A0A067SNE9_GALM3|nr:hypothetical protein GALMADRAFT_143253 [Galerina marginata CBS 339.88]
MAAMPRSYDLLVHIPSESESSQQRCLDEVFVFVLSMAELKSPVPLSLPSPLRALSQPNGQNPDNISNLKPSPIFKLHNDILWWIFWLNADMEDEAEEKDGIAAIDTLRHSSQVCPRWREIIMSFSSLWGQVINLSRLEAHEWREEVLRRTGKSLLSVLWGYSDMACLSEDVAAEILKRYWDRIRWLELDFTSIGWMEEFKIAQFWDIFQRPSEVLETFRITFDLMEREQPPILSPPDFIIFGNLAPAMRIFYAPNLKFSLQSHTCHSLNSWRTPLLMPSPPLEMHSLRYHGRITAPSIKAITLGSDPDIGPYMDFLAHIKPPIGCYLAFKHEGFTCDEATFSLANQVLYTYSRCCDFPSAIEISLTLNPFHFSFEAQIPRQGQFCFDIRYSTELPPDVIDTLFAALPSVKFQDLETLALSISPSIFKPSDSKISQFILSAPSVETLTVSAKTLEFLLNLPSDVLAVSFPVLHMLEISWVILEKEISTIKQFLISRSSIGRPIDLLSIPINFDSYIDLRSLDKFVGLTVILRSRDEEYEHTCGSGQVEDLLIRPRRQRGSDSNSNSNSSECSSEDE